MSLKKYRTLAGLSQNQLGQRLAKALPDEGGTPDYFQPRISAYENGRNSMPLPVALALEKVLNRELKRKGLAERVALASLVSPAKKKPRA